MMPEISLNVLDIAQNSVKAGATLIIISVEENTAENRLCVCIEDNGCGMDEQQLKNVTDPFFTSRTTRKVGLGVPFFKMAAELTGGSFEITSVVGKGTKVRADFVLNSIDRMPLGDMPETMCSLIGCNPQIDFVYNYSYNGSSFTADTREYRSVLEGVALNEPEVIHFIRESLSEQIGQLR